ncbi:prepilin peptidase [Streptomyces sp. CB09001]|uniref:prepilin peptidase n=1 Tax=Streptomyces sp. CB09001 TaxID=2083284 RepID=UPI000E2161B0|nr:A24 family peptidase [Streptomyces sp. CB09001]AXL90290.1 prepilin peptidase [Streptomyces sp. CB09001]
MSTDTAINAAINTAIDTAIDIDLVVVLVAALWGAATGALLPRAAYRFSAPSGEAWRERCPGGHPVRGWFGPARCGQCATGQVGQVEQAGQVEQVEQAHQTAYGPRTASLAVATALVCVLLAAATGTRPELAVWLLLAPVGVLLAVVDLKVRRLPDPLTLPLAGAALVLLGLTALVPEHAGEWTTALLGALALGAGYLVLFLINPAGMGFGDVKLALTAGAVLGWYGWPTLMLGTFAGFLLGALYGGALLVARRANRKTAIPFGPFLIAGAFLGVLAGAYAA